MSGWQKKQKQLTFCFVGTSDAWLLEAKETGPSVVERENESPARSRQKMMEEVVERENVNEAIKRVRANQGSPGVDGMSVDELPG